MSVQKYPATPAAMNTASDATRVLARPALSARYPIGNPRTATVRDGRDTIMDTRNLLAPSSTSMPWRDGDTAADPMITIMDAIRRASFVIPDGSNVLPLVSVNDMMAVTFLRDTA